MRTGIFLVLLGLLAGPALAQHGGRRAPEGAVPLDRLLPEIHRSHPGTFYDAEGPSRGADGQWHYHLKWMTPDGRVIWLDTNARTGRVLGILHGHGGADFYRGGPRAWRDGAWEPRAPRRNPDRFGGAEEPDYNGPRGGGDYGDRYGNGYGGRHGGYDRHGDYGNYGGYGGPRGGHGDNRGGHRGHGR
jgi:hypothetical protein